MIKYKLLLGVLAALTISQHAFSRPNSLAAISGLISKQNTEAAKTIMLDAGALPSPEVVASQKRCYAQGMMGYEIACSMTPVSRTTWIDNFCATTLQLNPSDAYCAKNVSTDVALLTDDQVFVKGLEDAANDDKIAAINSDESRTTYIVKALAKVYEDSLATIVSLYDAAGVEAVKDPKLNLEVGYALINMLDSEGSVIISFLAAIEDWKVRYKVPAEYQDEYEQASAIQATFYIIGATGTLEERGVVVSVKKVVGNKGPTKVDTLTTKLAANVSDSVMAGTKFDFRRVDDFKPLEFKPDSLFKDDHVQIVMSCDTGVVLKTQKQIAAAKLDMFENEKNRAYYAELMQNFSFNILANPIISLAYNDFREGNITIGNVVGMDLENNAYMLCNSIYKNSSWNDVKGYADAVAVADPLAASLVHSRKYHTASLLSSGKVLIAGGSGVAGNLSAAEIYDPATGLFTATGSMTYERLYHTASILPDGKVLIAGGYSGVSVAEIYDPATGLFTATGSMNVSRYYHTASLLSSGKVLIASGVSNDFGHLSSAEIYDPATGLFTATTGLMTGARRNHAASVLSSGMVLITGGNNNAGALSSAEIYDPATGLFTATGAMIGARRYHSSSPLPSGKVLIAGGYQTGSLSSAEIYDPAGNNGVGSFTATGPLTGARHGHTASGLFKGKILIAGGSGVAGNLSAAEIYDPGTELFLMDPAAAAILVEKQTAAVEKARAAEAAAAAVEEARAAEAAAAAAAAAVYVPALREYVAMAKKKALQLRSNAANVAMEAEKNPELWNKAKQLAEAAVEAAELWAVKAQELLQSTLEIANRAANDGSDAEVAAAKKAVEESEVGVMEASENMELAYIALEKAKNAYFSVGGGGE